MDACFLSSHSFTQTMEILPAIKGRVAVQPKMKSVQAQPRKNRAPVSVSCCQSSSSPPPPQDEEGAPASLNSDWRSFRAKLVAQERALPDRSRRYRAFFDPPVSDEPVVINLGDKWAHKILEPEKGCLLIATEKLDGVHIFERAVILLLSTGPVGSKGLILNWPSLVSTKEIRSSVLDFSGVFSDQPLFFGGPLEERLFLVRPKEGKDGVGKSGVFDEVMKGVYYGTKENVGCASKMVKSDVVEVGDFRFFDGYCSWDREQLRDEIEAGYWTVAACSPAVIGLDNAQSVGLWNVGLRKAVLKMLGIRKFGFGDDI